MVQCLGMNSETGLHGFKSRLTCCVALSKLTNLSMFQFPHCGRRIPVTGCWEYYRGHHMWGAPSGDWHGVRDAAGVGAGVWAVSRREGSGGLHALWLGLLRGWSTGFRERSG